MDTNYDVGSSLKVQSYLNAQNVDAETLQFISDLKFKDLMSAEAHQDLTSKVTKYRALEKENQNSPSAETSEIMQELAQDIMYSTGQSVNSLKLNDFKTADDLERAMMQANLKSKNDLYVEIDYSDYTGSSNFAKCNIVGHDREYAYGIAANARMLITKSGQVIVAKNNLYNK